MTENNAAQAVQESERNAAVEEYFGHRTWIKSTASNFRLFEAGFDRAYALLSKLRAEGVQAGDLPTMQSAFRITEQHGDPDPAKRQYLMVFKFRSAEDMNAADDEWRAALASAPVAGEAQNPVAWLYRDCRFPSRHGYEYRDVLSATLLDHYYTGRDETYVKGEPLYAAPQASEAVRNAALEEAAQLIDNSTFWVGPADVRALKSQSAALSAQPGAQLSGNSGELGEQGGSDGQN